MLPVFSLGQEVRFNFEDGDLADWYQSSQDHWKVVSEDPIEGNYSLGHSFDSEVAGTDWISLFHSPLDYSGSEIIWQFSLRYDFYPSGNNNWAVMLGYNCLPDDRLRAQSALVFGVNYIGNDDFIQLWGCDEGEAYSLLNTGFNWEENIKKKQAVDFRITLSPDREVSIEIDATGAGFVLLGKGKLVWDSNFNTFSILYKYTSTYDRGLMIDNMTISGNSRKDTEPPFIEHIKILNQQQIEVSFSEIVKATDESEGCIEGIGCISPGQSLEQCYQLSLPGLMTPGNSYILRLTDIADLYGNLINELEDFTFYYPAPYDIIISEIMADPAPSVLLPENEYIELYNRSDRTFSIEDWHLSINSRSYSLPFYSIQPGEYLVVCNEGDAPNFEKVFPLLPIKTMGAINNSGAEIILQDVSGKLIHAVRYSEEWYDDADKKEGGWSLEMIDTESPCEARGNWVASVDYRGGTPGGENSVFSPWNHQLNPQLLRVAVSDTGSLMVYLSEPMDSLRSSDVSYYSVDHSIGSPSVIKPSWPVVNSIELFFKKEFLKGREYQLSITRDPCTCNGTPFAQTDNNRFSIPQECDSADVIINEIMFDPAENCMEYIELYNRSEKVIELKDWLLLLGDKSPSKITMEYYPLLTGEYAIIAEDIRGIDDPDRFSKAQKVIEVLDMPAIPNNGCLIQIMDSKRSIIDQAFYHPSWHHELNADTKGVSLERVSGLGSGLDENNWQSASSSAGYQSPGAKNSQSENVKKGNYLTVEPNTITPNGDGQADELTICYQLDESDYMARVLVYDLKGRLRKTITNGSIPGTEGCYIFNGEGEDETVLPTGYYVLYFEAYNEYGKRFREKNSFVIAL